MAERRLLIDSDVFVLLAASGSLLRLAELLGFSLDQLGRLAALPHMLRHGKSFRRKYPEEVRAIAGSVAEAVPAIVDRPQDDDRLQLLLSIKGIQEGEALLYGLLAESQDCWLTSGDKTAMRALVAQPSLQPVHSLVAGRIICLESILKKLVHADGVAAVAPAWLPLRDTYKSLAIIFSDVNCRGQRQCLECLDSMLNDLQNTLGSDFLLLP
jgi:hypothetical protein